MAPASLFRRCPFLLTFTIVPALLGAEPARNTGPWDLKALREAPKYVVVEKGENPPYILYENEPYKGKPTHVFAYLAYPNKTAKERLPAMVLVHGGGGTAFKEWVDLWAKRGYVALAMDLAGNTPARTRLPDGGPDQGDPDKFGPTEIKDFWTYHAVAAVIRGVSLLSSLPEVDPDRIGITGISWGGYLTCIVAGLDDRLKVAVPVYGCGFIHENSVWNGTFQKMSPEKRKLWVDHFEPSRYVGQARMPVLFVNGTNDFAYPLDSYQKTYRLVKDRTLCVTVNMPHGHPQGWAPVEIGLFVDANLRKGPAFPRLGTVKSDGKSIEVSVKSASPVQKAAVHYTTDTGEWKSRKWQTVAARLNGNVIKAELPEGRPLVWFLTATDERKATVSTEHAILEK